MHFPLDMAGAVGVAALAYAVVTPLWRKVGDTITALAARLYQRILARPVAIGWIAVDYKIPLTLELAQRFILTSLQDGSVPLSTSILPAPKSGMVKDYWLSAQQW